jgi:nitroreductase
MDALQLLLNRRSIAKLSAPAPAGAVLDNILQAGLRAPDHGGIMPWRFVICQNEGQQKLADILLSAAKASQADDAVLAKVANAPFRAPMVIVVIANTKPHPKVPEFEQYLSAGCAVQAMQLAAVAQGYQGFWRSGKWMFDENVERAFGLKEKDKIVGFLYLGTPECTPAKTPVRDLDKFVEYL